MLTVDLLIHARWIIPVEPDGIFAHHALAVHQGRIVGLTPSADCAERYTAAETVTLADHVLIPGLINTHTHAAMSLLRGLADDLPLMTWLNDHIWPAEKRWVSAGFVHDGTLLAVAEMVQGGITCFNDMYFFPDVAARVADACGVRACFGLIVLDFPTAWASGPDDYFAKGLEVHDQYRSHPRISTAFAPHAPYTVSDGPLARVATFAEELDLPIQMHVHETADEIEQSSRRWQQRPLERLHGLGLLSPRLQAVHMTQLTPAEIALCAATGVHVVHCPESNLKLASGFCPVDALLRAGVNVALGTDGAASNNDLDMFGEMRTAALLAKGVARDATAVPARMALRMATLNGARAMGLDAETGSLLPAKAADLTAVCLGDVNMQPVHDPLAQLVYCGGRERVTDVWVAGRRLLNQRVLTTVDAAACARAARAWGERISGTRK